MTETAAAVKKPGLIKRLYNWVLHWAETPYAVPALFVLALAESSFFPIPPDALLIVMCLGLVARSFRYAAWCSVGSVVGGVLGYYIGYFFLATVGVKIINFYHAWEIVVRLADQYSAYGVWFLGTAGFTPIPYKVFTIITGAFDAIANGNISVATIMGNVTPVLTDGVTDPAALADVQNRLGLMENQLTGMKEMGLGTFMLVSAISRSARFFLVAALIYFFGERIRTFIEKYFNLLTIAFVVLLVLGFVLIKFGFGGHG
jgi:membrane protein YqaA with SNARE-associated domain